MRRAHFFRPGALVHDSGRPRIKRARLPDDAAARIHREHLKEVALLRQRRGLTRHDQLKVTRRYTGRWGQ